MYGLLKAILKVCQKLEILTKIEIGGNGNQRPGARVGLQKPRRIAGRLVVRERHAIVRGILARSVRYHAPAVDARVAFRAIGPRGLRTIIICVCELS